MALQHLIRHSALVSSSSCHLFSQLTTTKPVLQHITSNHLAFYHQLSKYFLNKKSHLSCCFHNGYFKQSKSHQANLTTVGHTTEKSDLNISPREAPKHLSLSPMKNSLLINTFSTSTFKGAGEDIGNEGSATTDKNNDYALSLEDVIAGGLLSALIIYTWINRRPARDKLITAVATGRIELLSNTTNSPPDSAAIIISNEAVNYQPHESVHYNAVDTLISTMTSANSSEDMPIKVELTPFIEEECESGSLPDPAETNFSKAEESFQSHGGYDPSALKCYIPSESEIPKKLHWSHKEKAQKTIDSTNGRVGRELHSGNFLKALKKPNGN